MTMTDEQKAQEARLLLGSALYQEAQETLRNNLLARLTAANLQDTANLQTLVGLLQCAAAFNSFFEAHAAQGREAALEQLEPPAKAERSRKWWEWPIKS
jgi:hypothetical protein